MAVTIKKEKYRGIPYLVYEGENPNRLIFVQHGIYGNKEKSMHLMGVPLADAGYMVVATDAQMHGERGEYPFLEKTPPIGGMTMPHIIHPTAQDILTLFEAKFTQYDSFDYLGISMGGIIGYHLLTLTDQVDQFYGVITTPDYQSLIDMAPESRKEEYPEMAEKAQRKMRALNPALRFEEMRFGSIKMFHGSSDDVVPISGVQAFYDAHHNEKVSLEIYDTDHHIIKPMFQSILTHAEAAQK